MAIGIGFELPEVWQENGLGRKTVARVRHFWYAQIRKIDLSGWEQVCPELITANERHRKWIKRAGLVGWILVALGVAGEGVAEYFVNNAETKLRSFDQAVLAETQQSANSAAMASSLANNFSNKAVAASSKAVATSKTANEAAGKAQHKAEVVAKQADDLNLGLLDAGAQLKAVDAKRSELEKTLRNFAVCNAPRVIPLRQRASGIVYTAPQPAVAPVSDPLKQFAGEDVFIEYQPFDAETRRATWYITEALIEAGLNIIKSTPVDGIPEGVEIQHFVPIQNSDLDSLKASWRSDDSAQELVKFLHSYNWMAKSGWPVDRYNHLVRGSTLVPEGGLRIRVGMLPAVMFVSPPGMAAFIADRERARKQTGRAARKAGCRNL